MQLNQFAYSTANFPSSVHDNQVILKMTGLNFRNSTYNPKTGNNTNEYQLLVANIATSTSATISSTNGYKRYQKIGVIVVLNLENKKKQILKFDWCNVLRFYIYPIVRTAISIESNASLYFEI